MKSYRHDLVISAVSYDALLVAELETRFSPRLRTALVWVGHSSFAGTDAASLLNADASRIALVLHQRLWRHDGMTSADDAVVRERVRRRPESVYVVALDEEPIPDWLAHAPRCDFATVGVDGAAEFALNAITTAGGSLRPIRVLTEEPPEGAPGRFVSAPQPFLAQPRAHSALRRELDSISDALEPARWAKLNGGDRIVERHLLPNRLIARLDDVGISFSWVAGRLGTVADGRLLVIQWGGVTSRKRGISALNAATPVCERVYRVEATGPDEWNWRTDDTNGRACSTEHLVAEWIAAVSVASNGAGAHAASEL